MTDDTETPRLEITISLDRDDPLGMHTFLRELPFFGFVDGWAGFEAVVVESDGSKRDAAAEANTGNTPVYMDAEDDNE